MHTHSSLKYAHMPSFTQGQSLEMMLGLTTRDASLLPWIKTQLIKLLSSLSRQQVQSVEDKVIDGQQEITAALLCCRLLRSGRAVLQTVNPSLEMIFTSELPSTNSLGSINNNLHTALGFEQPVIYDSIIISL